MVAIPKCWTCKHFLGLQTKTTKGKWGREKSRVVKVCKAFPDGMPEPPPDLLLAAVSCVRAFFVPCPGDNGIEYEATDYWGDLCEKEAKQQRKEEEQRKLDRKKRLEEARRRASERQEARFKDPELFQRLVKAEFERRREEQSGEKD